jgi:hypothetical protein
MSYDLHPNNQGLPSFCMASDWLHLLEQCGAYFACVHKDARWYAVFDERMSTHYHHDDDGAPEPMTDNYPAIICNCGFEVTDEEAKVMARIARNYAAIQRSLPDPTEEEQNTPITTPDHLRPFPKKIRGDWVENYERFAEWAEKSQGFKVY